MLTNILCVNLVDRNYVEACRVCVCDFVFVLSPQMWCPNMTETSKRKIVILFQTLKNVNAKKLKLQTRTELNIPDINFRGKKRVLVC